MPGSHGPKQSGSVMVPTDVPTHISTISFGSLFIFFAGGGLVLSSELDDVAELDVDESVVPLFELVLLLLVAVVTVFSVAFDAGVELVG